MWGWLVAIASTSPWPRMLDGSVVDVVERVPQQTARRRRDQVGLATYPDLRLDGDPQQIGLELPNLGPVTGLG